MKKKMKTCANCTNFPCIDAQKTYPDQNYWASLINEKGCQSHSVRICVDEYELTKHGR